MSTGTVALASKAAGAKMHLLRADPLATAHTTGNSLSVLTLWSATARALGAYQAMFQSSAAPIRLEFFADVSRPRPALLFLPREHRLSGLLYDCRRARSPRGDGAGSPWGTGLLAKRLRCVHRHRPPQPSHRNSQPNCANR